ncbi:MAG: helix-turn-helix domain-containing protein [Cytophagales bacterium]|nr:helix-turn-helix domain-containing protein [Cytophagales bacterium]
MVLLLVVWAKREKKITDYVLVCIIVAIGLYVASDILIKIDYNRATFLFRNTTGFLPFIPIFLYGLLITSDDHRLKKSWGYYFIFHLLFYLFILGDVMVWNDYSVDEIKNLNNDAPWAYHFFFKGIHIYMVVLLIWFLGKLRNYQNKIHHYYSNIDEVDLSWFRYFLLISIFNYSASFAAMIMKNVGLLAHIEYGYLIIRISILISLIWMFYHGLRQYALANFDEAPNKKEAHVKYATSALSKESAHELFKEIELLFEKDKLFLNPDLRVQDVAKELSVSNHNVSQSINETSGMSFYDYVNHYRLNDFKAQLSDPQKRKFTILALGMESGFNSKASINRVFKKQLGETPREYQRKMLH